MALASRGLLYRARVVLADALGHFNVDDGWAMASHVALSALMALFPFLIFVAAFAGSLGDSALANRVAEMVFAAWPADVAQPIASEVRRVLAPTHSGLLTVSAVVALFLASNGIEAVRTALNRAYRVVDRRNFFLLRAQSLVLVLTATVAILALAAFAVLTAALPALRGYERTLATIGVLISSLLVVGGLVVAHIVLPAGRPSWRHLWPGIVATLVLWLLSGWIFAYYIGRFANYTATYAGLAGVVTVMFFLYILAVLMIFGAEFNAALARLREGRL
jgi:membrane protein